MAFKVNIEKMGIRFTYDKVREIYWDDCNLLKIKISHYVSKEVRDEDINNSADYIMIEVPITDEIKRSIYELLGRIDTVQTKGETIENPYKNCEMI